VVQVLVQVHVLNVPEAFSGGSGMVAAQIKTTPLVTFLNAQ